MCTNWGIVLNGFIMTCINKFSSLTVHMQGLDSGEKGHKITVALTRDNKLCNRFKNITVCK